MSSCHPAFVYGYSCCSDARSRFKVSSNWTFIPFEPGLGASPRRPYSVYPRLIINKRRLALPASLLTWRSHVYSPGYVLHVNSNTPRGVPVRVTTRASPLRPPRKRRGEEGMEETAR